VPRCTHRLWQFTFHIIECIRMAKLLAALMCIYGSFYFYFYPLSVPIYFSTITCAACRGLSPACMALTYLGVLQVSCMPSYPDILGKQRMQYIALVLTKSCPTFLTRVLAPNSHSMSTKASLRTHAWPCAITVHNKHLLGSYCTNYPHNTRYAWQLPPGSLETRTSRLVQRDKLFLSKLVRHFNTLKKYIEKCECMHR
jgi:hypothetical protein